jgi:beta-lactam-binding protein with PASTA domain
LLLISRRRRRSVSDYISAMLQEGSEAVALAAKPSGPQVIRARGDRRRRRRAAGLAIAALAVVAVGAGSYPMARHLSTAPTAAGGAGGIVPRVAGDTLVSAERAVVRAGLSVGHVSRQHSDAVALGLVVATSPRKGAFQPKGARVNIVVSAGGGTIVVPDVIGMTESAAEQIIQALQMQVEVRWAASPAATPGTITAESPAPGVKVPRGSLIVLSVEPAKHGS